jgi:predicted nucleic acid-binding protein
VTYLDTSALVKLFVEEPGSAVVATLVTRVEAVATAKIAYAEVHAGLARRHRAGDLSTPAYDVTWQSFEEEWPRYTRLDLHDEILQSARTLIQRHPLRGFDAIHLASALSLQSLTGEATVLVAAGRRLLRAAAAEQIAVLDAERAA